MFLQFQLQCARAFAVIAAGSPGLNATALPNIAEDSKHSLRPATIAVPIVTIVVWLTITIISYYVIRTRGRQVCLKILKLRRDNDNTCAHVHVALEPHTDHLSFPSEQTVASGHDHYSEIDDNGLYEDIRTTANSQEQDTTSLRETASTVTTTQQKAIYVIDPVCDDEYGKTITKFDFLGFSPGISFKYFLCIFYFDP